MSLQRDRNAWLLPFDDHVKGSLSELTTMNVMSES